MKYEIVISVSHANIRMDGEGFAPGIFEISTGHGGFFTGRSAPGVNHHQDGE
jgi:hypothetical protein